MNIDGQPLLKAMNATFRSRVARVLFSWLVHPDLALKFGQWWSGKSRKSHGAEPVTREALGFLTDYARQYKASHDEVDAFVFGHMHLPLDHDSEGLRVLFLSDWSGDAATYAAMDDKGDISLKTFDLK